MVQLQLFNSDTNYNPLLVKGSRPMTGPELGRARIEEVVNKGKAKASRVIEYVQRLQPVDRIVKGRALHFRNEQSNISLNISKDRTSLHNHALRQVAERAHMPSAYMEYLLSQKTKVGEEEDFWGAENVAAIFNDTFKHNLSDDRFLTRSVDNQVRGFLSDRFRRLDSRIIFDAVAESCAKVGALPYEGYVSETKVGLQAILPNVYEPIPGEIMAYGMSIENSDFGNGALNVLFFLLRLVCLNGAIGQTGMRKVHLGKRLEDNVEWSSETYKLDTKTIASAVKDLVLSTLSAERLEAGQEAVRRAYEDTLTENRRAAVVEILKKSLIKSDMDRVIEKFNEPDVELLPPGNNVWRMSNAVSWLANQQTDDEKRLEIMKVAGRLLPAAA